MNAVQSEYDIRNQYAEKVALMPPALVAEYVPLIKAYHRKAAELNQRLAEMIGPFDAELEAIEKELVRVLGPNGETFISLIDAQEQINAAFDTRHPGLRHQWIEACETYSKSLKPLKAAINEQAFRARGGTLQQLQDLEQAVLYGVFSRRYQMKPISDQPQP